MIKDHILIKNKNFRRLLVGGFVSSLGTNIQSFALSLYVLNLTGSATAFAAVLSVAFIPKLLLLPVMGVVADWFDRKKMLVGLDFLSGIIILGSALYFSVYKTLPLIGVYVIVVALAVINCLFSPTAGAVLPMITSKEERPAANSMNSFFSTLSGIVSPILAGLLMGLFGIGIILLINGISFILSAMSEQFIKITAPKLDRNKLNIKGFLSDMNEGVRYTFTSRALVSMMIVSMLINCFLGSVYNVVIPFSLRVELGYSETLYGMTSALAMSGMFIGMFFYTRLQKRISSEKIVSFSTFMIGGLTTVSGIIIYWAKSIAFGLSVWIVITILMMVVGAFIIMSNIAFQTIFQNSVEESMYGRVGALMSTVTMAMVPMGQMVLGLMTEAFSSHLLIATLGSTGCFLAFFYNRIANDTPSSMVDGTIMSET